MDLPEKDTNRFWKQVGKKRNGALEGFVGKRKAMEEAVGQIISPERCPEAKLRKIYDRVQQIRNTSYEIRKTEQEEKRDKEKLATNVEEVWKRGYGDGGQLTWLISGVGSRRRIRGIRMLGFRPPAIFLYSHDHGSRKAGCQRSSGQTEWQGSLFRSRSEFTPYGLLTWAETGTPGLRLDGDGGTWIQPHSPRARSLRSSGMRN